MHRLPSGQAVFLLIACSTGTLFLLFFNFGNTHSLLIDRILDFGHVPLFSVVTAMVLSVLDWKNWPITSLKNYTLAGFIAFTLALLTEALQQLTPERSFQVGDIVNDLVGSVVFLLIAYQYKRNVRQKTRVVMSGIVCILLLSTSLPVLTAFLDDLHARRVFPLLSSFETSLELEKWKIEDRHERSVQHATNGKYSLRVDLTPGLYPGISFNQPSRDWQGFDTLAFDAFLEGTKILTLTVRINDLEHNDEYEDRYNMTFTLSPGPNRIMINLAEVECAPKGRKMDMGRISVLCIFSYKLNEQRTVYFDNFRLEKKGRR